jgi:hypothetical protein
VAVVDRFTHRNLQVFENLKRGDAFTLKNLFDVYDPRDLHSTPGIRSDLFNRPLDKALVTDFFGAVQNIEITNSKYSLPDTAVDTGCTCGPPHQMCGTKKDTLLESSDKEYIGCGCGTNKDTFLESEKGAIGCGCSKKVLPLEYQKETTGCSCGSSCKCGPSCKCGSSCNCGNSKKGGNQERKVITQLDELQTPNSVNYKYYLLFVLCILIFMGLKE